MDYFHVYNNKQADTKKKKRKKGEKGEKNVRSSK